MTAATRSRRDLLRGIAGDQRRRVIAASELFVSHRTGDALVAVVAGADHRGVEAVVDHGRIHGSGTHDELLAAGGRYAELRQSWTDLRAAPVHEETGRP